MKPTLIYDRLDSLAGAHRSGHRCQDGEWYNPHAGARTPCPVSLTLAEVREEVSALHASVHEAAHDDDAARRVAEGMTGLVMADLEDEDREGWTLTARRAIEALAEHLDRDPAVEQRAAEVRARLAAAGLRMIDRAEALAEEGDRRGWTHTDGSPAPGPCDVDCRGCP